MIYLGDRTDYGRWTEPISTLAGGKGVCERNTLVAAGGKGSGFRSHIGVGAYRIQPDLEMPSKGICSISAEISEKVAELFHYRVGFHIPVSVPALKVGEKQTKRLVSLKVIL